MLPVIASGVSDESVEELCDDVSVFQQKITEPLFVRCLDHIVFVLLVAKRSGTDACAICRLVSSHVVCCTCTISACRMGKSASGGLASLHRNGHYKKEVFKAQNNEKHVICFVAFPTSIVVLKVSQPMVRTFMCLANAHLILFGKFPEARVAWIGSVQLRLTLEEFGFGLQCAIP